MDFLARSTLMLEPILPTAEDRASRMGPAFTRTPPKSNNRRL